MQAPRFWRRRKSGLFTLRRDLGLPNNHAAAGTSALRRKNAAFFPAARLSRCPAAGWWSFSTCETLSGGVIRVHRSSLARQGGRDISDTMAQIGAPLHPRSVAGGMGFDHGDSRGDQLSPTIVGSGCQHQLPWHSVFAWLQSHCGLISIKCVLLPTPY